VAAAREKTAAAAMLMDATVLKIVLRREAVQVLERGS
jgi:hypothetical protein